MEKVRWTQEMLDRLMEMRADQTATWGSIAARMSREFAVDLTWNAVRFKYQRPTLRKIGEPPEERQPEVWDYPQRVIGVVHETKRPPEDLSFSECLDAFHEAQGFRSSFSISYRRVRCRIDTDEPIALACISDVHLGSPYCDYGGFKRDMVDLSADPRFYIMKGGDWADKFMQNFKDASAPAGQVHPATVQLLTIEKVMAAFEGRIVAAIGGNHDRMDQRLTGMSSEFWIHRGKEFPYLPTGGLVELVVGRQTYNILWTHQYGTGNSRLNKHNVFRWLRQELHATADIYILEHHHDPSIYSHELEEFGNHQVVEIRTGSYKLNDPFSEQFFKAGRRGPQTVILHPDQKKVTALHGHDAITDAKVYLDGWGRHAKA